jgi:16S rRNA (cytosine1402-N4)-methyltransferase
VLLDLGLSSFQLDAPGKGFSYRIDEPLDMRFDRRAGPTAADVLNSRSESELARIIAEYGEERRARAVARAIVRRRPLNTTGALFDAVSAVVGGPHRTKSLSRVFQAIRIEVNGELENLESVLNETRDLLIHGGRLVVIAYHSLEDRMVKRFMRETVPTPPLLPATPSAPFRLLTRRALLPGEAELRKNPRARSARLRAAERLRGDPEQG